MKQAREANRSGWEAAEGQNVLSGSDQRACIFVCRCPDFLGAQSEYPSLYILYNSNFQQMETSVSYDLEGTGHNCRSCMFS